jgi:hypothetical protein
MLKTAYEQVGDPLVGTHTQEGTAPYAAKAAPAARLRPCPTLASGRSPKNVEKIISGTSRVLEQNGEQWADELNAASPPNRPPGVPAPAGVSVADRLRKARQAAGNLIISA